MSDLVTVLKELEKPFAAKNAFSLAFESECHFAVQQIIKQKYTLDTARNNQTSLKNAIMNVAAIGISLNPAQAHAYLVPRDGAICLDVSYRGLVKLATDSGAIEWAKAVLVYEGDVFEWRGPAEQPLHKADVFNTERMNAAEPMDHLKGGYCLAKLSDGSYMVDVMTAAEILEVRQSSKAYTSGKPCPWKGKWSGEMAKKTLVKRASKSWPQSSGRERLDHAIEVLNEHEGLHEDIIAEPSDYMQPSKEQTETYLELAKGDSVDFWLWYRDLDQRIQSALPGCEFPRGEKGKMMAFFNSQIEDGRTKLDSWIDLARAACDQHDDVGFLEIVEDMPAPHIDAIIDGLNMEYAVFARGLLEAAA